MQLNIRKILFASGLILPAIFIIAFLLINKGAVPGEDSTIYDNGDDEAVKNEKVEPTATSTPAEKTVLNLPLTDARARVTKKSFGIKVSPDDSPVTPEKFSGYHTGVDFETFPEEAKTEVAVKAVCVGKVLVKRRVKGFGGVLVQSCELDNQKVTVLYGHLALSSITAKFGATLAAGDFIGNLGTGYSYDTDGERKHLHLGIHRGITIEYRGYVQTESELAGWIDYLGLR